MFWKSVIHAKKHASAQFTVNLEWCASEAHTRGESLLRGHGANRVKSRLGGQQNSDFQNIIVEVYQF